MTVTLALHTQGLGWGHPLWPDKRPPTDSPSTCQGRLWWRDTALPLFLEDPGKAPAGPRGLGSVLNWPASFPFLASLCQGVVSCGPGGACQNHGVQSGDGPFSELQGSWSDKVDTDLCSQYPPAVATGPTSHFREV